MKDLKRTIIATILFFAIVTIGLKIQSYWHPVVAQEKAATNNKLTRHIYTPITIYDDTGDKAIKRLMSEWKEYSAECYADSELVRMGYFRAWDTGETFKVIYNPSGGQMITNLIEVKKEWIHSDPTFIGFMQFLEEKYEK